MLRQVIDQDGHVVLTFHKMVMKQIDIFKDFFYDEESKEYFFDRDPEVFRNGFF